MASSEAVVGSCNCGRITVSVPKTVFPENCSICHCRNCRTSSGSLFSVNLQIPLSELTISGNPRVFEETADSGFPLARNFCGDCGSPILSISQQWPTFGFVKGGLFTKKMISLPKPKLEVYWKNHETWEAKNSAEGVVTID